MPEFVEHRHSSSPSPEPVRHCSAETRLKISQARTGKSYPHEGVLRTPETRKKISCALKKNPTRYWSGKTRSEDTKEKIRERVTGKHHTPETKKKLSEHLLGKRKTDEHRKHISESKLGSNNPQWGKPLSEDTKRKMSDATRGAKAAAWKGGISFEPYCDKFSRALKEEVRDAFGRKCVICGDSETQYKLHIHHVDYNKRQGCGHKWNLVPLCRSCHMKTGFHRHYWFNLLSNCWAMKYDFEVI